MSETTNNRQACEVWLGKESHPRVAQLHGMRFRDDEIAQLFNVSRVTINKITRGLRKKKKGSALDSVNPENSSTHEESTTDKTIVADSSTSPEN